MPLLADVTSLSPTAQIELFELDLSALGGGFLRFHAGTNELGVAVVWQGQTYTPGSIEAEGFSYDGSGPLPRPKLRFGNVTGTLTGYLFDFDDLKGAKITRKRTLAAYLDAVNFAAGNPGADPDQQMPDEVYFIDRLSQDDGVIVEFELGASYDVLSAKVPAQTVIDNLCDSDYRSGEGCDWTPDPVTGPWFDANDLPTTEANDKCSHRLTGCKCRFLNRPLPFGGFPGAGLVR